MKHAQFIQCRLFPQSARFAMLCGGGWLVSFAMGGTLHAQTPAWEQQMLAWPLVAHHAVVPVDPRQEAAKCLKSVLKNMAASESGLLARNAGEPTQAAQKRVVLSLDELIKLAEKMSQGSGKGKQHHQKQQGSMGMQASQGQSPGHGPTMSPSQSATQSYLPGGGASPVQTGKPFESQQKQWGNLPPRARNLIINAMRNESLPRYKGLVNAYYRALGRMNEKQ